MRGRSGRAGLEIPPPSAIRTMCACVAAAPRAEVGICPSVAYRDPEAAEHAYLRLGPLAAAGLAWLRHPLAPTAAFVVGAGLLIWVAVEVAIIGYSNEPPLQAVYAALGVAIVFIAARWVVVDGWQGPLGAASPR